MKKNVFIRTSEISNCWETNDACIVELKSGKKWVCKIEFYALDKHKWNTLTYIQLHLKNDYVVLELIEKGKSEHNG